ncbi:MAG: GNAT family N-acetyltransferase [Methanomicrobiales archaeon]|nr:GNAT family N-acetyltransferase [Methanomicrobiales archaeon]
MEVEFSTDRRRLRMKEIHAMLSATYWSTGITKEEIRAGNRNSALVVGAYTGNRQVGFCRVISDKVRFAYLLDVIVAEDCRRKGIGKAMVRYTINHPEMKHVYQWLLKTGDAHAVYEKCGFLPCDDPSKWMGIMKVRPDRHVFKE